MGDPRRRNAFYHGFQFAPSRESGKNACPSAEVGLAENGDLWAWGWNIMGQLGDKSCVDRNKPVKVTVK